jgi:hypothetical protein
MTLLRTRPVAVGLLLMVATCVTWWLGADPPFTDTSVRLASTIAVVIAFVKVRYVGLDFMGLRAAPRVLRLLFEGWVLAVGVTCALLVAVR